MRYCAILVLALLLLASAPCVVLANSQDAAQVDLDKLQAERAAYWRSNGYVLQSTSRQVIQLAKTREGHLVPANTTEIGILNISPNYLALGLNVWSRQRGYPVDYIFEGLFSWTGYDSHGTMDYAGLSWSGNLALDGDYASVTYYSGTPITYVQGGTVDPLAQLTIDSVKSSEGISWHFKHIAPYIGYSKSGYFHAKVMQTMQFGLTGNLAFTYSHTYSSTTYSFGLTQGGASWTIAPDTDCWSQFRTTTFRY